jgi:hypothetical protein
MYKPQFATAEEVMADRAKGWRTRNLNDAIQLARTWQDHDIANDARIRWQHPSIALAAIRVPVLYMPERTDLYFPLDRRGVRTTVPDPATFVPIPSLWGHTAGGGGNPTDAAFHQPADRGVPGASRNAKTPREVRKEHLVLAVVATPLRSCRQAEKRAHAPRVPPRARP